MFIFSLIVAAIQSDSLHKKLNLKMKKGTLTLLLWFLNMAITPFATIGLWIVLSVTGIMDLIIDAFNSVNRRDRLNQNTYNQNNINQQQNPYYNSFSQPGTGATGSVNQYTPNNRHYQAKTNKNTQYNSAPFANKKGNNNVANPYNLPRSESGRTKIINKFNSKYDLNLSNTDINTMSSATYMSLEWASEVYAMTQKYDSIYEWLGQGNIWLRVYLYAFNIQNISPVFNKQEELVYNAFNTIFTEMCYDETLPTEVIIENINNKYMTRFDEASFLLAINYMESKGRHFKFGSPILTRVHSDIDDLAKKYQTPGR